MLVLLVTVEIEASPCLGSVDVTPWRIRAEFADCHYITVSSPLGGSGGFSSVNFSAFSTRRASGSLRSHPGAPLDPPGARSPGVSYSAPPAPLHGKINACFHEPTTQGPLHQQRECSYEEMSFHSLFDLMIDRPHRQHVLELSETPLDVAFKSL